MAISLLVGVGASLLLSGFASGLLFQIDPIDPMSMLVAAPVLGCVALGATFVPALRATRVQPAETLRSE